MALFESYERRIDKINACLLYTSVLLCIKQLLKDDDHWKIFVEALEALFEKYEHVDIKTMGFPEKWEEFMLS